MSFPNAIALFCLLYCLLPSRALGQSVDHWEAAVIAEEAWHFFPGETAPPENWHQPDFDDSAWNTGIGGFGYDDGDDNTILDPVLSVYLRKEFEIIDTALIAALSLYADYDDAFVAYLNGREIARANIGTPGVMPAYDETAITYHEAQLYQGGMPENFSIEPEDLFGLWNNGSNTLAIQVHNVGIGSSDLSALFFLIFGIADNSMDYQPVPAWFPQPFDSSTLPLFFIDTDGMGIPDEPKINAHLGIIDNGPDALNFPGDAFNGYDGLIGIELRGSSSLSFEKKSYGFETRNEDGENNNVSLLGMPEENDWILYGPYSDKSLMRNVLSFHIGNQMGRYATRTRWCELFINEAYMGVYILMEKIKIDANRVDIAEVQPQDTLGDELTGGYIFSVDRDDEGPESGWYSPFTPGTFYNYHDPDQDMLIPVQKNYLRDYVTDFEADMIAWPAPETYEQYIDLPSFIDYWLATEIFKHIDNFKFSFFMYKKKDSNGGKIHFGPLWDLNLGYGNFDFAQDPGPEGWSYPWINLGFLRPFWVYDLSIDPLIQDKIHCRWNELRQGSLHTDSLIQFIDLNAELIEEASIRNFERWPVLGTYIWPNSFVGVTYEEELNFLKDWLTTRLNWMDKNMVGECLISEIEESSETEYPTLRCFPNPFNEELNITINKASKQDITIRLYDVYGKLRIISTIAKGSNSCTMKDLFNLPEGICLVCLETDNARECIKVIKSGE